MEYVPIPSHTQREKEKTQRYNVIQYVKFVKIKNFIFNAYIKENFLERLCKWSLFLFVITSRSNRILTFKL